MTTEIAEKVTMENLHELNILEAALTQVISLSPSVRSQLSARYYQQYSSTKTVTDLRTSILIDECSLLEEIENNSANGTGAGPINTLLQSIASKYAFLYENTRNVFHLGRALEALGRLVEIPVSSTSWTPTADSDDPSKANAKVKQIAAKTLSDTQVEAVNQTSSVLHKLWEATNDGSYLGKAITSANYWLLLTSCNNSDKPPGENVPSDGDNKASDKEKIARQRYALLRDALGWVVESQQNSGANSKTGDDDSALPSSEANHIMALTTSFTEKELKKKVFPEMAPKVLWEMGKLLSTRYAEYCNVPDAERCLTLGMGMFHYAVHLETNKKEKHRYLVNWRILNTLRKRRFGIYGDGEEEEMQLSPGMLNVTISWNAHREAMAKFTDYRHFGMRMKEAEKVQLLEDAIALCHDALRIGRRVLLQPNPPRPADRPAIDDWMRNFGEMVYEKLQRCISDKKDAECEEIKKLVEDELDENRAERIYNMNPQASILNLVILARVLFMLYRQNPDKKGELFEIAMKHAKDALETVRNGLPGGQKGAIAERAARNALSIFSMAEHERTGKLDDLNKAINQMMKSLMSQKPHQNQGLNGKVVVRFKTIAGLFLYLEDLKTLASALMLRYRNTGDYRDLLTAINHQRTVVKFSMPDRFLRAGYQVRLSEYLNVQVDSGRVSSKEEKEKLLEEAIVQAEKAWKVLMTDGDVHMRAECLLSLTSALQGRYMLDKNKNASDHTAAVEKLNLLLSAEDQGPQLTELDQARLMNKLCKVYDTSEDLNERLMAGYAAFQAVELCPQNLSFLRAEFLYDKARLMQKNDDIASAEEILEAFKECFDNTSALTATRLKAAVAACRLLKTLKRWEDLYDLAAQAMALFSSLPIRSLTPQDQQKTLEAFSGFGTMVAAAALEAGKAPAEALMILEQGRDIIARQKFDTRIDITDLREAHSDLADEFERLRDRLDSPAVNTRSMSTGKLNDSIRDFGGKLERANEGLRRVIKKIHDTKGFSRFLEPPNEEELKRAAGDGSIVVINVAEWRCDAFIVRNAADEKIESIPLPRLSQEQINQKLGLAQPTLRSQPEVTEAGMNPDFLQYLWEAVAEPVLSKLGHDNDLPDSSERALETYPRIWWCPTGNASRLPLHAASSKMRGNKNCVMRRVVSSYTSSIKTLIFSRRQAALRQKMPLNRRGRTAVLCSVRKTFVQDPAQWDSLPVLEGAPQEIGEVEDIIMTATQQPSVSNTIAALRTVHAAEPKEETLLYYLCPPPSSPPERYPALFHFAGHGYSNPIDPSKSCLFTTDSPLEVAELVALKLHEKAPLLAYLSACSTGVNLNGNDGVGALTDEGIHVMGAMQLVGFMSVIGALWKVEDSTSMRVAKMVYEEWLGDSGSGEALWEKQETLARCLHHAVMELRNTLPQFAGDPTLKDRQPLHWASFIHMGV